MSKKYIHKHFIKKCKELGISSINEYPFTSRDLGQRSLYAYAPDYQLVTVFTSSFKDGATRPLQYFKDYLLEG